MNKNTSSSLRHYLAIMVGPGPSSTLSERVTQGADCVSAADLIGIRALLPQVMDKAASIDNSNHLRFRIELLARFVTEVSPGLDTPLHRESVFVLFYLLHGGDLIPDSIPEIGLLDDALLIETVINRNQHELRAHWVGQGRVWPETPNPPEL